jgi:hypothetical protein
MNDYLGKTNESNVTFNSVADPDQLRQRIDEAKKMRSQLARHGYSIILPFFQATAPLINHRAKLPRFTFWEIRPEHIKRCIR